jgi:hypothetical protein
MTMMMPKTTMLIMAMTMMMSKTMVTMTMILMHI